MTKEGGYAQVPSVSNQCAARRVVSMTCRSRVSLSQPRESLFDALGDPLFRFVKLRCHRKLSKQPQLQEAGSKCY